MICLPLVSREKIHVLRVISHGINPQWNISTSASKTQVIDYLKGTLCGVPCHRWAARQPSWLQKDANVLSGKHASHIYQATENDWVDRLVDVWSYNHRCHHVLVWRCQCMAGPNISRASQAIRPLWGLDAVIRGSGSPSTWMTPERITAAALNSISS